MNKQEWTLRAATPQERQHWNELINNHPDGGSFLQTVQFAAIKKKAGWHPRYFVYQTPRGRIATLALMRYIFSLGEMWYFPKGPGITDKEELDRLARANRRYVLQNKLNVFLIKLEPELVWSPEVDYAAREAGLVVGERIQANTSTILLNLDHSPDQLMESLHKRAQKNIRLGMREDVQVRAVRPDEVTFRQMYELMTTVSGGRGADGIRPYEYYRRFWYAFTKVGMGKLYFAFEDGTPVVGAFVIVQGKKATYKDGGSRPDRGSKAAAYLLQWHIIQELASQGVQKYDLCGVPSSERIQDRSHPLYGVGFFKSAFSKEVIDYCGVYDQPTHGFKYVLWRRLMYPYMQKTGRMRRRLFY